MDERPRIKPTLTIADKASELAGWLLMIAYWVFILMSYQRLPDTIPTHFGASGQADGFGGKSSIFILPAIATVFFIGLTVLNKFSYVFNYPTAITKDNASRQYTNATRLIRYLKLILVIVFGLIDIQTIRVINGQSEGLGVWFLPMILGLFIIPLLYFVVRAVKMK